MSGHSKWTQIKRQKGSADIKKGNLFTKLGNAIALAARYGKDPASNPKLREALLKAKTANMPSSTIDRAIKRGSGQFEGERIEELTYEAYGPEGVAFIVRAITDNKNRTSQSLKHIFSKYGGSLAGPGAVTWMLDKNGEFSTSTEIVNKDSINKINKIAQELEDLDDISDFDFSFNATKEN